MTCRLPVWDLANLLRTGEAFAMPLYRIYSARGLFSAEDKEAGAELEHVTVLEHITSAFLYLLRFYVVVVFLEVDPGDLHVGRQRGCRFVRVSAQHLARTQQAGQREKAKVRTSLCSTHRASRTVVPAHCAQDARATTPFAAQVAG